MTKKKSCACIEPSSDWYMLIPLIFFIALLGGIWGLVTLADSYEAKRNQEIADAPRLELVVLDSTVVDEQNYGLLGGSTNIKTKFLVNIDGELITIETRELVRKGMTVQVFEHPHYQEGYKWRLERIISLPKGD